MSAASSASVSRVVVWRERGRRAGLASAGGGADGPSARTRGGTTFWRLAAAALGVKVGVDAALSDRRWPARDGVPRGVDAAELGVFAGLLEAGDGARPSVSRCAEGGGSRGEGDAGRCGCWERSGEAADGLGDGAAVAGRSDASDAAGSSDPSGIR